MKMIVKCAKRSSEEREVIAVKQVVMEVAANEDVQDEGVDTDREGLRARQVQQAQRGPKAQLDPAALPLPDPKDPKDLRDHKAQLGRVVVLPGHRGLLARSDPPVRQALQVKQDLKEIQLSDHLDRKGRLDLPEGRSVHKVLLALQE